MISPGARFAARLTRALDGLSIAGMALAGVACLWMAALVTVEVLIRWMASRSTQIADEWSGYLLLAASFLGLGYTARHDGFIRVELLFGRLGPRAQAVARAVNLAVAAVVGVILLVWLGVQAEQSYRMAIVSTFVSQTPLWVPQLLAVAGIAIFLLQLVAEALRLARGRGGE